MLKPKAVEYAVQAFGKQLVAALSTLSVELGRMRERKRSLEAELANLTAAVAVSGHSPFLLTAIADRERELRDLTERLLAERNHDSVENRLAEIRKFTAERLFNIRDLLNADVARARAELGKHVSAIRMAPQDAEGKARYVADGEWNLLAVDH